MADWHNTEDKLPNVGWPVIGEDSTGRKIPMLYGEDGEGGWCWQVQFSANCFEVAEFTPVRWRYEHEVKALRSDEIVEGE